MYNKLISSLNNKSSSFILYGAQGVGKQYSVVLASKFLLCQNPNIIENLPCNMCSNCQRINTGNHPNVIIIEPENKVIKIDTIRDLIKEITFSPTENGVRIIIINDAHRMNDNASNALLKTLEEPPLKTVFILITNSLYRIPATIKSRCEILKFPPMTNQKIAEILNIKDDHKLLKYAMGSASKMSFYLSIQDTIVELVDLLDYKNLDNKDVSFKAVSDLSSKILDSTSNNIENLENILALLQYIILEKTEHCISKGIDYSHISSKSKILNQMFNGFYLNTNASLVMENMLFETARQGES